MFGKKNTISENILILGLGGVGYYLAKRLTHEGYAITVIEADIQLIREADGILDARLIQGNAMSIACWREANADKMDYLIAVTDNDAVNMMAAKIGHRFGIEKKIARVRSLEFGGEDSFIAVEDLNIDLIIHPEELAAQEIVRIIKLRSGNDIVDIADNQIQVLSTRIQESSPLANKRLLEFSQTYHEFPFRVVALARGINSVIPGGNDKLMPQDQMFIMAGTKDLPKLMNLTGVKQQRRHRVMILGGGLVGHRVAQLLEKTVEVTIVEKDEASAEALSFSLKNAEVLHGDGSDASVLQLAGLLEMDTFITATGDNETNIMSCLLAKHLMNGKGSQENAQQRKSICLVNKDVRLGVRQAIERGNVYRQAGADCIFVPDMDNLDEEAISLLVREVDAPINIIAGVNTPPISRLQELGVARVSLGPRPMRAALSLLRDMSREIIDKGTYKLMTDASITYSEVNQWFSRSE